MFKTRKALKRETQYLRSINESFKEEIKDLKDQKDKLNREVIEERQNNHVLKDEVKQKQDRINKLERERDILYQYYDLNKEPTQEIKTQMRINKRVYDLELENIRLNTALYSMTNAYTNYLNTQLCNLMTQSRMCNQSIMPMVPYSWR